MDLLHCGNAGLRDGPAVDLSPILIIMDHSGGRRCAERCLKLVSVKDNRNYDMHLAPKPGPTQDCNPTVIMWGRWRHSLAAEDNVQLQVHRQKSSRQLTLKKYDKWTICVPDLQTCTTLISVMNSSSTPALIESITWKKKEKETRKKQAAVIYRDGGGENIKASLVCRHICTEKWMMINYNLFSLLLERKTAFSDRREGI